MSVAFAKKIGMTRLFVNNKAVPVTVVEIEPTVVLQKKTMDKEGYNAVQVGAVKTKKVTAPLSGHIQKAIADAENGFRLITEFRDLDLADDKAMFDVNDFAVENLLDITGTTIGKGFTGAVKRWGFAGQPQTHGHDHVKAVGSIGARWPQRVPKGKKMAGKHGGKGLTFKKVKIVAVDTESGLLFIHGSLPGANSSYLKLRIVK
jgi:large subunit ribosomal protein L3